MRAGEQPVVHRQTSAWQRHPKEVTSPIQSSRDSKKLVKAGISRVKCSLVQLLRR